MPKYRTKEVYWSPDKQLGDGTIGKFVNDVRNSGEYQAMLIKFVNRKEADTSQDKGAGEEEEYTAIQGNVGSS